MPDPTNHVGQCIQYRVDMGQSMVGNGPLAPVTNQTTAANVSIGNDPRNPGMGGTPWVFTFLKYNAGEVTSCLLNGNVMTGPFTGCYAFTYSDAGQPKLAHVGTNLTSEDPGSIRAKQVWSNIVAGGATNIKGESPAKHFTFGELSGISAANQRSAPVICGYYEGGNAWAIVFVPAVAGVTTVPGALRIAAAKRIPLLDWNLVRAMREFR